MWKGKGSSRYKSPVVELACRIQGRIVCFFFLNCLTDGIRKFPGQRSNPHHSSNLGCCSDNAGSSTCCATEEFQDPNVNNPGRDGGSSSAWGAGRSDEALNPSVGRSLLSLLPSFLSFLEGMKEDTLRPVYFCALFWRVNPMRARTRPDCSPRPHAWHWEGPRPMSLTCPRSEGTSP